MRISPWQPPSSGSDLSMRLMYSLATSAEGSIHAQRGYPAAHLPCAPRECPKTPLTHKRGRLPRQNIRIVDIDTLATALPAMASLERIRTEVHWTWAGRGWLAERVLFDPAGTVYYNGVRVRQNSCDWWSDWTSKQSLLCKECMMGKTCRRFHVAPRRFIFKFQRILAPHALL